MKASDLIIKALEGQGVEYIFGLPGEENLDLLDSIAHSEIHFITTRHEQAAAFMAATYGRLTGKPGVCLSTLGPGATNLLTGVAYAFLGGMPMIVITGQKPIKNNSQALFQILDIVEMMDPITKFSTQIVDVDNIPSVMANAFRISVSEKPGPVHLEIPEDIAQESTTKDILPILYTSPPSPSFSSLQKIKDLVKKAKSPLVLLGSGANRHHVYENIDSFILENKFFFFTTQMGKGVVNESSPFYLGTASMSENDFVHQAINESDLIISIGYDITEKPPFDITKIKADIVHIDYSPARIEDAYHPNYEVIGCIATALDQLTDLLKTHKNIPSSSFLRIKETIQSEIFKEQDFAANSPQKIVSEVRKAMPDDSYISLDNGFYKIWFARNYPARMPNSVLLDNALASMGAGLPVAIAAKIVHPNKPVIAICGDGGFLMSSQELETANRLKLDLVILILEDKSYGMIKWKQSKMKLKDFGLDFNNPDFQKLAEAYGIHSQILKTCDHLHKKIKEALSIGGIHLLSIPIDYYASDKTLPESLKKTILI